MSEDGEVEWRYLDSKNEEADPDYVMFRALHQRAIPKGHHLTNDVDEQFRQVAWWVDHERLPVGWLLAQLYWGDIQMGDFMANMMYRPAYLQMLRDRRIPPRW